MLFIYQPCSWRSTPIDHCVRLSYFSSVFLDFRFVLTFCIFAVYVHCVCALPLSGVIKNINRVGGYDTIRDAILTCAQKPT